MRLYLPVCVESSVPFNGTWPRLEEDKRVCELMMIHGLNKVGSGTYSKCKMNDQEMLALMQKL